MESQLVVLPHPVPVDEILNGVVVQELHLVHLVAGAEAIEEVLHRHAGLHGHQVGEERAVLGHLHGL